MAEGQLTHEEIERMRQILAQHDSQHPRGIKEFDLNNPPKEPYRHQEFPRLVYMHATGGHKRVHSAQQLKEALAAGWSIDAVAPEAEEPELSAEELAEIEALDKEARKPRKPKSE